jgi:hypothetical protein
MAQFIRARSLWLRNAIAGVAVVGFGIALVFSLVSYLERFSSCRNVVLSSTRSPDGTKAVFVFRQECNATVPDSVYASIATTDRSFLPDRHHAFLGAARRIEVLANWRGNDVVEIALIPSGGTFVQHDAQADNIEIDYK